MADAARHVLIIGGGASGVLLAAHLLRARGPAFRVTVVERRADVGLGTAYSTSHPQHLLNVRAANMSAFADDPDHFLRWLAEHWLLTSPAAMTFAPRMVYGRYLASLVAPTNQDGRLRIVRSEATDVTLTPGGVAVEVAGGERIAADYAVLATGFTATAVDQPWLRDPWAGYHNAGIARGDPVLVLGTGLTMVDLVLSLKANGHTGPIHALSRRGLLPNTHRQAQGVTLAHRDVPFAQSATGTWRWLVALAKSAQLSTGDWRGAVDAIRPFTAEIWQRWPDDTKRRFMRHARPWWDTHRHRMAPAVAKEMAQLLESGQLRVIAGNVVSITGGAAGATVAYRPRGTRISQSIDVACVFPCMGASTAPSSPGNPLVRTLVHKGLARSDSLGLGLEVGDGDALVSADGQQSDRVFAIGPITRAAYWEMVAVPDIRLQCARLSRDLVARDSTQPASRAS